MAPRRIDPRALPPGSALARTLRLRAPAVTVSLDHDGERVTALEGEPVALALAAAGRTTLARSPKYHRPRGPSCLRGACDGCLVRIDGVPNVMACRVPARDGLRVESQNAFPTAGIDLLRVTDWFFPKHMDHHHLMVGLGRAANRTMQAFARRMAGLGTLPDDATPVTPAATVSVDVLVVGAGSAGTAAANALGRAGLSVLCADDERRPGGALLDALDAAPAAPAAPGTPAPSPLDPRVQFRPLTVAVATYDNGTLLHALPGSLAGSRGAGGVTVVTARARLLATGCRDTLGGFAQNDVPGVYTARAFVRALAGGVLLGERVVVVGASAWARAIVEAVTLAGGTVEWLPDGTVAAAHGGGAVRRVTVSLPGGADRTFRCDALVVAATPTPAYELAGQAGVDLAWEEARRCFAPVSDPDGATTAPGVYVAGSLRRAFEHPGGSRADGERVAARVARDLGGSPR